MPKNNYQNREQDRRIEVLEKHFGIINSEMGDIKTDLGQVKQDVCWLKKTYWVVTTASVGGLAVGLISLIFKK